MMLREVASDSCFVHAGLISNYLKYFRILTLLVIGEMSTTSKFSTVWLVGYYCRLSVQEQSRKHIFIGNMDP